MQGHFPDETLVDLAVETQRLEKKIATVKWWEFLPIGRKACFALDNGTTGPLKCRIAR